MGGGGQRDASTHAKMTDTQCERMGIVLELAIVLPTLLNREDDHAKTHMY